MEHPVPLERRHRAIVPPAPSGVAETLAEARHRRAQALAAVGDDRQGRLAGFDEIVSSSSEGSPSSEEDPIEELVSTAVQETTIEGECFLPFAVYLVGPSLLPDSVSAPAYTALDSGVNEVTTGSPLLPGEAVADGGVPMTPSSGTTPLTQLTNEELAALWAASQPMVLGALELSSEEDDAQWTLAIPPELPERFVDAESDIQAGETPTGQLITL
jgi:hypothetical protein